MIDSRLVTASIQVLPLINNAYPIVDQAIEVMEGALDDCLAAAKAVTLIRISDSSIDGSN